MRLALLVPICAAVLAVPGTSVGAGPVLPREDEAPAETPPPFATPATRFLVWNDPRNARVTLGVEGGVGLFRLPLAQLGQPGLLRLGVAGELVLADDFPVLGAQERHLGGRLSASYVPLAWLEAFLTFAGSSSFSTRSTPPLIQSMGDLAIGLKAAGLLGAGFSAGAEARFLAYPAGSTTDPSRFAFGLWPRLLLSFDARQISPLPLRLHAAGGVRLDWNSALAETALRAAEAYALQVNRFHRATFGAGLDVPLPWVTPFLEYTLAYPLGVTSLVAPDGSSISAAQAMPQVLGTGVKVTALREVTFVGAMEFALHRRVGLGVPATPPIAYFLGLSLNLDLVPHPVMRVIRVVEERVQREIPPGRVEGHVVDAESGAPLGRVLITFPGTDLPPVASAPVTGAFRGYPVEGEEVHLLLSLDGYAEKSVVTAVERGAVAQVAVALQPLATKAIVNVLVTAHGQPLAATIQFKGPSSLVVTLPRDATEAVPVEVTPGKYTLETTAEGHLSQTRELEVASGSPQTVQLELKPSPRRPLVEVKGNHLELSQAVHFAAGKTRLLPDSYPLLQQVVDTLVKHHIARVRIEGHTDNLGNPSFNERLSASRASAVADYLVSQGIDRSRLETAGFGGARPVAPNLTARGRELNRRVDFIILER
jgi:outer membrane protein OmpA-like peptidoglycan-associated protein